jgi:hypothetical protein
LRLAARTCLTVAISAAHRSFGLGLVHRAHRRDVPQIVREKHRVQVERWKIVPLGCPIDGGW